MAIPTFPQLVIPTSVTLLAGKAVLSMIRHLPAPWRDSVGYALVFDVLQDLASNPDRIGERRP